MTYKIMKETETNSMFYEFGNDKNWLENNIVDRRRGRTTNQQDPKT